MTAKVQPIPAYPSKSRLATELDMAESTVDAMVERGVLPRPVKLSTGCVRWCWAEVETALLSLKNRLAQASDGTAIVSSDPYMAGVQNVAHFKEGRRGPP
jgi:predicted DNA-binding transcriptional regulator AlpA